MLTHLLFSISALILIFIFIITYFSYKKKTDSLRSKIYFCMICFALALTLIEIIEGITYVYNVSVIFSLMWKLHTVTMILFIAGLFYYLLLSVEAYTGNEDDLFWDSKNILSIRNFFTIIFVVVMLVSIVYVKTYSMGLTMFYFYTNQSMSALLILYGIYILYNFYIVYLKTQNNSFKRNDYIILFGTFILFISALVFEYLNSEISMYSTLFTLVLILLYYFKENEDLIIIEELQKAQIDLNSSNELKLDYLHDLMNDLENPLKTFGLINKKLEDSENLADEELRESIKSLNNVSNDLVNIFSNQSSNKSIVYRIDELAKNVTEVMDPSIRAKGLKFSCNIDQNLPSLLEGDSISIHRIISNLLFNAIRFTDVGRIILNIAGEKTKDGFVLNIKVSDTGAGIKAEDFGKVFLDDNSEKESNLALTKRYVDKLNGSISFESNYGSGTIFYVSIPQKISNEAPLSEAPMSSSDIIVKDYNNKRILMVDSEDYSSNKLTNILKKYNFTVESIKSGMDAVNMIKNDKEFDLIIINENVKDMPFVEVGKSLGYLKRSVKLPPIIGMVVNTSKYNTINYYDEFLLKPLSLKRLDEVIKRRCN